MEPIKFALGENKINNFVLFINFAKHNEEGSYFDVLVTENKDLLYYVNLYKDPRFNTNFQFPSKLDGLSYKIYNEENNSYLNNKFMYHPLWLLHLSTLHKVIDQCHAIL